MNFGENKGKVKIGKWILILNLDLWSSFSGLYKFILSAGRIMRLLVNENYKENHGSNLTLL